MVVFRVIIKELLVLADKLIYDPIQVFTHTDKRIMIHAFKYTNIGLRDMYIFEKYIDGPRQTCFILLCGKDWYRLPFIGHQTQINQHLTYGAF